MVDIRAMRPDDWSEVHAIYAEGIATGAATFETEPPSWKEFDRGRLRHARLVAVEDDSIVGWATLAATSTRACYSGVAEHSLYVAERARGRGIGLALLTNIVAVADETDIWTIQTSIFPENTASLALHEKVVGVQSPR